MPNTFSVERTYILFRTMGLRHLMVIDEHCHVRGIVTRKDLLGHRLGEWRLQVAPEQLFILLSVNEGQGPDGASAQWVEGRRGKGWWGLAAVQSKLGFRVS